MEEYEKKIDEAARAEMCELGVAPDNTPNVEWAGFSGYLGSCNAGMSVTRAKTSPLFNDGDRDHTGNDFCLTDYDCGMWAMERLYQHDSSDIYCSLDDDAQYLPCKACKYGWWLNTHVAHTERRCCKTEEEFCNRGTAGKGTVESRKCSLIKKKGNNFCGDCTFGWRHRRDALDLFSSGICCEEGEICHGYGKDGDKFFVWRYDKDLCKKAKDGEPAVVKNAGECGEPAEQHGVCYKFKEGSVNTPTNAKTKKECETKPHTFGSGAFSGRGNKTDIDCSGKGKSWNFRNACRNCPCGSGTMGGVWDNCNSCVDPEDENAEDKDKTLTNVYEAFFRDLKLSNGTTVKVPHWSTKPDFVDVTSDTGDDDVQEETHTTAEACRLKAQKKYLERDNCLKHLTETDCLKHNKYCEWEDSVCLSTTKFVAEYSVYDGKDQEISNNGLADTHDKPMMLSRCKIREISRHSEIPSAAPWFIFDNWDGLAFDGHENNSWYSYRTYLASDPAHPEFENSCSHLSSLEGPCKERSECVWTAAKDGIASRCDPKPVGLGKCYHHLKNTTAMKKHGMSEITFDIPSLTIPRDTRTMVDEHYCVEKDYYVVVDDGWCTIPFESEKLPVIEHLQTAECRLAPILMPFEEPKLPIIIDGVFYNNMVGRDKVGPCERTNWGGHCMGDECQCQPGSSHACDSQSGTRTPVHGADRDTEEEEINYDVVQNLMGRENVQIWKSYESEADCKAALESYHHTSYEERTEGRQQSENGRENRTKCGHVRIQRVCTDRIGSRVRARGSEAWLFG